MDNRYINKITLLLEDVEIIEAMSMEILDRCAMIKAECGDVPTKKEAKNG